MAVYMLAMGFLMVTRVKYAHFSNKMLGGRKRFRHLIGALALLMVFFWQPEALLMLGFNGYVVYGLVTSGLAYLRERRCLPADEPQVESKSGIINLTQSAAADSSEEAAL
jgi:phosphatidylserine synthase